MHPPNPTFSYYVPMSNAFVPKYLRQSRCFDYSRPPRVQHAGTGARMAKIRAPGLENGRARHRDSTGESMWWVQLGGGVGSLNSTILLYYGM